MLQNLQLLIKPASGDCNVACRYCFYRRVSAMHGPGAHRMSDDVLQALIRRYLKLRLPQSVFAWQGGEPALMGLDFFRRAIALMQQHGRNRQSVSNALQTNGLLIDHDWCKFLREYSFLVGLSLDGPANLHDHYRVWADGGGTHADVLRTFRLFQETGVEFNVLAVVSDVSAPHARTIYRYFRDLGLFHMQFIPCIETDPQTHKPTPFSVSPEAFADFLCELFDAWLPEAMDCVSIRLFDGLLNRELTGNTNLCYLDGSCGECPVVEYNGDVYPCDFFVRPALKLGNIMASPLEKIMARPRARRFRNSRRKILDECKDCPWRDLCRGGCLKDRERIAGAFNVPAYFCETYKRFFEHAMDPIKTLAAEVRSRHPDRYPSPQTQP